MAKVNFEGLSSVAEELESRKLNEEDGVEVQEEEDDADDEVEEEQDPEDDSCKFSEYDDIEELTDDCFPDDVSEEYRDYCKQAARTGGFDVPNPPKGSIGAIYPITTVSWDVWTLAEEGAEIAVEHYNDKRAPPDGKLQVVEIEKVTCSPAAGMVLYITVEAENVFSGEKKMYQTKVYWRFNGDWKVRLFRKKKHAV